MFVRVKLPNGAHSTVTRDHAELAGLRILDRPAVDAKGRPLPAKPAPPKTSAARRNAPSAPAEGSETTTNEETQA